MNSGHTIVDLFCGCGGFGLGAELAGFNTILAVDIDPTLQSAYKKNFPKTHVLNGDLSQLNEESWRIMLNGVEVDGVIGGPPCQGYSRMGKSDQNDPRRTLLGHFFRNVNIINPKFFIMENVEGLMDKKNIHELNSAVEILDKKYTVLKPLIVDSSLFGAPTKRKRVILIGYNSQKLPPITIDDFHPQLNIRTNVHDAISDLAHPIEQSKDKNDFGWNKYPELHQLSDYAKKMRSLPKGGLGWSESINKLKNGLTSGHFNTIHLPSVAKRYAETEPGTVDKISRAKKLSWLGLCPTLRAGTGADKGSHQAVRPLHPVQPRVITVREAARLQGFPDWFIFHPTKWHSFRMIGNSVSPIVSEAILSRVKQILDTEKNSRKTV